MRKKAIPEIPETVLRSTERSPLFWLLHQHHAVLAARWKVQRVDWKAVCTWAGTQQAWDRTGSIPKPGTAQKTWQRVCRQHAREKAEREAKLRPAHLRSPAVNHVPVIAPPPQSRSHPPAPQETSQSDVERRMALMQATINRRSGRPV